MAIDRRPDTSLADKNMNLPPVDQIGYKVKLHPASGILECKQASSEQDIARCHMVKIDIYNYAPNVVVYLMADNMADAMTSAMDIWKEYIRG